MKSSHQYGRARARQACDKHMLLRDDSCGVVPDQFLVQVETQFCNRPILQREPVQQPVKVTVAAISQ